MMNLRRRTDKMAVLARNSAASESAQAQLLLLLALLACATATTTSAGTSGSVCDTANCGKGDCTEVPPPALVSFECDCDPGWSRAFKHIPFSPCTVPNCSFDSACFNLSLTPPKGITTDICDAVSCGTGGACKKGDGLFVYTCECQPGYVNLLNLTSLPCVKNCFYGRGCSALGLAPPPSPAPPGNHDSSGPSAPPSGTKCNATTSLGSTPNSHHAIVHYMETLDHTDTHDS